MIRRSPVDTLALASSLTISAAVAISSVPPGGWTGPLARSMSDSNPCRGTESSTGRGARFGALPAGLAFFVLVAVFTRGVLPVARCGRGPVGGTAFAFVFGLALAAELERVLVCALVVASGVLDELAAELALRAAVRRALERWGRVRGRLASTPTPASGLRGRPLPSIDVLIGTSLLNRHPTSRLRLELQALWRICPVTAVTR